MIKPCIDFIKFLDIEQKKKLFKLQILIFFNSIFEIFGVSLIVPFIGLLANPTKFFNNEIISFFYLIFEFENRLSKISNKKLLTQIKYQFTPIEQGLKNTIFYYNNK